jgi:hypothetical protein
MKLNPREVGSRWGGQEISHFLWKPNVRAHKNLQYKPILHQCVKECVKVRKRHGHIFLSTAPRNICRLLALLSTGEEERSSLFWVVTQRVLVIYSRLFGTTYRSHPLGSRIHLHDCTVSQYSTPQFARYFEAFRKCYWLFIAQHAELFVAS